MNALLIDPTASYAAEPTQTAEVAVEPSSLGGGGLLDIVSECRKNGALQAVAKMSRDYINGVGPMNKESLLWIIDVALAHDGSRDYYKQFGG